MESTLLKKPTAVDLFAGCGALSLGLRQAGFRVTAAVEINTKRGETYARNHPDTALISGDIRTVRGECLLAKSGCERGELDLVAGCPPCQGFSRIRRKNSRKAVADQRNQLVLEFGRIVRELRPRAFMMENVPGLERDRRFKQVLRSLRGAGYKIDWAVLDLADYGVPQRRRRLVMVGARGGERPRLSALAVSGGRTVRQAIEHLPRIPRALRLLHYYKIERSTTVQRRIERVPADGGSRRSFSDALTLDCHKKNDGFKDVYGRMAWDKPAPTITGGCISPSKGRFLHPTKARAITVLEAARLQGFPIWYRFDPQAGRHPIAEMIGEALPPRFASITGRYLLRTIQSVRESE